MHFLLEPLQSVLCGVQIEADGPRSQLGVADCAIVVLRVPVSGMGVQSGACMVVEFPSNVSDKEQTLSPQS